MSIINEALKKTEQYIQENAARNRPQGSGLENHPPTKIHSTPSPLLIYILILLAGILLSKLIFSLLSQPENKSLASSSQNLKPSNSQNFKPENKSLTSNIPENHKGESDKISIPVTPIAPILNNKTPEVNFVLNGIFFSDNDGYALVNNQIVRENDLVDGAKIIKITTNNVELDSDGKLINLSNHR
ncbi:MAG: hypothetical protein Q7S42_06305 [Candidatus Omnitrophota bacterium]|nr:hypothetical protein [Candidatus Omnitrophota bacterium]